MDFEEKIKIEPINDYEEETKLDALRDHDYCKNSKLEKLLEPKLEEPDYFEMDRPSEISPEPANFEYPDYLKLESVDYYDSSTVQAQTAINTVKPVRWVTPRVQQRCSVCSIPMNKEYFISTRVKNRKFIVILGAVLSGKMAISKAKALRTGTMTICPNHFPEAIAEIFKILNITQLDQMYSCSIDNKLALMKTVHSVSATFTFIQLYESLLDYFWKDGSVSHTRRNRRILPLPVPKSCSVPVASTQPCTTITLANRRLILMVGAVLSRNKTVEEAQSLTSEFEYYTSEIHLSEAIDEIHRALNIRNIGKMQWCSTENKRRIISIVNSFSPQFNFAEFSRLLEDIIQEKDHMNQ